MRRAKTILAVAAAMALMLVASVAPVMAATNDNDRRLDRQDIRLDRQLLDQNDNNFCDFNNCFDNDGFVFFNPFFFGDGFVFFDDSCPFAGDTEGIVNEFDCFD